MKSSKHRRHSPYANRRTRAQATLTAVRRVFRIYLSAGATTATAALRAVRPVAVLLRYPCQEDDVERAVSCLEAMVVH